MGRAEQDEFLSDSAEQISITGVTAAQRESKKGGREKKHTTLFNMDDPKGWISAVYWNGFVVMSGFTRGS